MKGLESVNLFQAISLYIFTLPLYCVTSLNLFRVLENLDLSLSFTDKDKRWKHLESWSFSSIISIYYRMGRCFLWAFWYMILHIPIILCWNPLSWDICSITCSLTVIVTLLKCLSLTVNLLWWFFFKFLWMWVFWMMSVQFWFSLDVYILIYFLRISKMFD